MSENIASSAIDWTFLGCTVSKRKTEERTNVAEKSPGLLSIFTVVESMLQDSSNNILTIVCGSKKKQRKDFVFILLLALCRYIV